MKLSNFRELKTGISDYQKFSSALVDVTTGFWWNRKMRTQKIRKDGASWYFIETGKFTPGWQAEDLERSYKAKMDEEKTDT